MHTTRFSRYTCSALLILGLVGGLVCATGLPAGAQDVPAMLQQAGRLYNQREFNDAEREYRKVLQADPANADARMGLCAVLNAKGNQSGAKACLLQLTTAHPKYQPAYYLLGTIYESENDSAAAKNAYQRYVQCDPSKVPPDPALRIKLRQYGVY